MKRAAQNFPARNKGSALLAALCFCAVLGIALASYVGVCHQTLRASTRTNASTSGFELAEAGLEEGLNALNRSVGYTWSDWTLNNATSPKTATKTLEGFSFGNGATGIVTVTIDNYDGGTPTDRLLRSTATITQNDHSLVTRKLQATAKLAPMFVNAVAATYKPGASLEIFSTSPSGIHFINGGTVDSIDSSLPSPPAAESEEDKYLRELPTKFSAVVSSADSVELRNTQVSGYVAAGTETPASADSSAPLLFSYLTNPSGGSLETSVRGPATPSSRNIDASRLSSSPYQPLFTIKEPAGSGLTFVPGSGTIGYAENTTGEIVYRYSGDLNLTSETITVEGNVVLVVFGNLNISGTAQIRVGSVDSPNATLQIIVKGSLSTLTIGGNGILNTTGRAKKLAIFYTGGDGAETSPTISTLTDFCGVIYAPNCSSEFVVSSDLKYTGSLVAKSVLVSGTPAFRYDLDLRTATQFSCLAIPFTVSSWQEVAP